MKRDTFRIRASRFQNGIRGHSIKQTNKQHRKKICLKCGKSFISNSATQLRCGPFREKSSCAYKAMIDFWKERDKKRKPYMREYSANYRKTHPNYWKIYLKTYAKA